MPWLPTIVDEYVSLSIQLIQEYGWYLIFLLVTYYFMQPVLEDFRAHQSLRNANDPARTRVLNAERDRIRAKQAIAATKGVKK
jgi:hypothetical protein